MIPAVRCCAAVLLAGALAGDGKEGAEASFLALQEACRVGDATALKKALPERVGRAMAGGSAKEISAWREGLAAALASAVYSGVRESGDEAVARCNGSAGDVEIPLRRGKEGWAVDAPVAFLVRGKALDAANGKSPAALRLAARARNGEYGDSAFSFAHVTRAPSACANRMDIWYCHNGDLHAVGDGALARVAAKDLASVREIPVGAAWKGDLAPESGGVYVMRCRREGHRDFLVKFRAVAVDERKADLEWALLGAGFGSPASIHEARPIATRDGPDGFDGLCARNAERSKPEPAPVPGTATPR